MRAFPNLTALRFFLAFLVVIFHVPMFCSNQHFPFFDAWAVFHKGNESVKVFFSLSGFLIIGQLYAEKQKSGTIALHSFFVRRMLRIFPLYYLILFFGLFYYRWLLPTFGFPANDQYNFIEGMLLAIFFMPNSFFLYKPGSIIEILWSIGIEEQFYLFIAPLFLWLRLKYAVFFLALFSVSYFLIFHLPSFELLKLYQLFFFYFSASGLYVVLILKYGFLTRFNTVFKYFLLGVFVLYFTTSWFVNHFHAILYEFFSVLLFALTIAVLASEPIAFLENKILKYLGKISYGIYMFHCIVIQICGFIYLKWVSKTAIPDMAIVICLM